MNDLRPYIIWVPCASRSNGVRALLNLGKHLISHGFTVYYYVQRPEGWDSREYPNVIKDARSLRDSAVVIYPEIVYGNPLRVRNVVRYILYYPSKSIGPNAFHHSEKLFAYEQEFCPEAKRLFIPWIDDELFYCGDEPRAIDCTFVYKGGRWRDIPELSGLTEITCSFPPTREAYANLLRKTKTLYSYDGCSAVLEEAHVCGAKVKIITETGFEDFHSNYLEKQKSFPSELDEFIRDTQRMDYHGRLQSTILPGKYWQYARLRMMPAVAQLIETLPLGKRICDFLRKRI